MNKSLISVIALTSVFTGLAVADDSPEATLTPLEIFQGWESLSGEQALDKWSLQRFKKAPLKGPVIASWSMVNSELTLNPGAGNLHTQQQFDHFELKFEWKIKPGGKSGVVVAAEDPATPWQSGFRFQLVDNDILALGKDDKSYAGSCHQLIGAEKNVAKKAGEWNSARIVKQGFHYRFFLNGIKTADFVATSPRIRKLIADSSKLSPHANYGLRQSGYICFEDLGSSVSFRAIKIRPLTTFVTVPSPASPALD